MVYCTYAHQRNHILLLLYAIGVINQLFYWSNHYVSEVLQKLDPLPEYHFIHNMTMSFDSICCTSSYYSLWQRSVDGSASVSFPIHHDSGCNVLLRLILTVWRQSIRPLSSRMHRVLVPLHHQSVCLWWGFLSRTHSGENVSRHRSGHSCETLPELSSNKCPSPAHTFPTLDCIKVHLTIGVLLLLTRFLIWTPNAVLVLCFCSLLSTSTVTLKGHPKSSAS